MRQKLIQILEVLILDEVVVVVQHCQNLEAHELVDNEILEVLDEVLHHIIWLDEVVELEQLVEALELQVVVQIDEMVYQIQYQVVQLHMVVEVVEVVMHELLDHDEPEDDEPEK